VFRKMLHLAGSKESSISIAQFRQFLTRVGINATPTAIQGLFQLVDANSDNKMSLQEFTKHFFGDRQNVSSCRSLDDATALI